MEMDAATCARNCQGRGAVSELTYRDQLYVSWWSLATWECCQGIVVLLPDNHQLRNQSLHGDPTTVDENRMPRAVTERCRHRTSHHETDMVPYQGYTKEKG
jgi:hypothetical protein